MKSFKSFVHESDKNDANSLRMNSLATQKKHVDDAIKQTRKHQQLQKAYKTISKLNSQTNIKKPSKNEKK